VVLNFVSRKRFAMSDSPVTKATAGVPNGVLPDNRVLLILAADHRGSLERGLYGLTAPPTPAQAARISADKLLIYQALLDTAAWLPAQIQPGVLIDEQYGASVAELAPHAAGALSLGMPLEASGQEWFRFAYGDDWQQHAEFFAAKHAKVLVRDNPGLNPARREEQARRLGPVSAWAARTGRSLIVELQVPATGADTLQVMEYLQDRGVEPAFWTVQGLGRHDDAVAVAAMAQRGGRQARCLVGGRHAPYDELQRWMQVAAPIPGWAGFAIGRCIWWDPLRTHLRHRSTAGEARRRIRDDYVECARYYLKAREGILPAEPDPVQ
jgi:myo-inositol catabolism protein IolC